MELINRLFKRLLYRSRRKKGKKHFIFKCKKSEIKILGNVYFFGNPKIVFNGPCIIFPNVSFGGDGVVTIGKNVTIGKDVSIYSSKEAGVSIGNDVGIAANSYIIDCNHGFSEIRKPIMKQPLVFGEIKIMDNVWIGANSMVLKGVIIKSGVVVGAMSLVNKNLEADSVYVGSPAIKIKNR